MCAVRMMVKATVGIVILSCFLNLVPIRETPSRTLHREAIHYKTIKILKFSVFYCLLILEDLFISWEANMCCDSCSDGAWDLRALRFNIPTSQHR